MWYFLITFGFFGSVVGVCAIGFMLVGAGVNAIAETETEVTTLTCFHCGSETVVGRPRCEHCNGELQS
jgi:hypothetical protein